MSSVKEEARKELARRELARRHLIWYAKYLMPRFQESWFHKIYYDILQKFADGTIKKLIVSVPPQHGKSQGSSVFLPSYMLGHNPDLKIAIASYSQTQARKFGRNVKRALSDPKYNNVFTDTRVPDRKDAEYINTADEFEIADHDGSVILAGRGSGLTGNPVDILLLDDLYKDFMEANSPVIRESVIDWYTTVADSRLHNASQQLIVFTRWHNEDLIGWIEENDDVELIEDVEQEFDDSKWYKINFEAIKTSEALPIDTRKIGEALWPERHSKSKLENSRRKSPEKFESLYQGNPKPLEGLLYSGFKTYTQLPEINQRKNYTDTADTGTDYLCSIDYGVGQDGYIYVLDIIYTQEPMEITEESVSEMVVRDNITKPDIESNNGGRGFARAIQRITGKPVHWFHQSGNKESRIISHSATVQEKIIFPQNWMVRWPDFARDVTNFRKMFKANKHDDAPDTLTGIIEMNFSNNAHSGKVSFVFG